MKKSGTPTKYPGVSKLGAKTYRVRGKFTDPRTGKRREVDRILENVTLRQAARRRDELLEQARVDAGDNAERVRVGEYAQSWIASKAIKLDRATARSYADALEKYILPTFGEFYFDALTSRDVQAWIDRGLTSHYVSSGECKRFARNTVKGWFSVLRTMTRDAMQDLALERDPTMRITLPPAPERREPNALTPVELQSFLITMSELYPQHYPLTVTLAYTGLRFCHVSGFRWEDWDTEAGTLAVRRKHVKGNIGPVSRNKRAPRVIAIMPALATVLRDHRAHLEATDPSILAGGWMFPNTNGNPQTPSRLSKPFRRCLAKAGIDRHVTVHGMRYTFTDLARLADIDPIVRRSLVGHTTTHMQHHYSTVRLDEKRAAARSVIEIAPLPVPTSNTQTEPAAGRSGTTEPTEGGSARSGEQGGDMGAKEGGDSRE